MNNRGIQLLHLQGPTSLIPLLMIELGLLAMYFRLNGKARNEIKTNHGGSKICRRIS